MNCLPTHKRFKFQQLTKSQVITLTQFTDAPEATTTDTFLMHDKRQLSSTRSIYAPSPFEQHQMNTATCWIQIAGCIQWIYILMNKTLDTDPKSNKTQIKD